MQDTPDDESEEGGHNEDIIKHCKSNQQFVESFSELFPFHDDDCQSISYKHDDINDTLDRIDDYQAVLEHQHKWRKLLQPRMKIS